MSIRRRGIVRTRNIDKNGKKGELMVNEEGAGKDEDREFWENLGENSVKKKPCVFCDRVA